MIKFVDQFQYQMPSSTLGEKRMKALDNEGIFHLFNEAYQILHTIQCQSDVIITFQGTSTRNVYAKISGLEPDVAKIYRAMERWFRENAINH